MCVYHLHTFQNYIKLEITPSQALSFKMDDPHIQILQIFLNLTWIFFPYQFLHQSTAIRTTFHMYGIY